MVLATLLCATLLAGQQEPRVSARLSTTSAAVGATVVLEVVVEDASGSVSIGAPRLPQGIALIGTQDFTEMHISFPGGRRQTRRREYALQPATPGRFRIAPIVVTSGSRSYRTNAVELVVTGAAQPRSIASTEDAWLRASMQPETVYVGQQSTLTVEAGFSEDVRVRLTRPPVFEAPSPTGFWVQDVPGGVQSRLRSVNGAVTEIHTLQRAYFPLSAGRYAFAPARAVIDVREGFLFAPETREIRSQSPKLTVLPLPESGRPPDFKGAVGSYELRAFVQPDTVAAGEAAQITLELSGTGNIKAAPLPVLPQIAGVEQFAPTEDATISFDGATVGGVKRFQWVIIPEHAGRIDIPAARYVFFDPASRSYRAISSAPLTLFVTPAGTARADDDGAATALDALRTQPQRATLGWVRSRTFVLLQLVPLLAIALALLVRHARRRPRGSSALLAELKRIRAADTSYPEFLRELESLLRAAGRVSHLQDDVRARSQDLIARIETQRVAPAAAQAAERASLLQQAESLLREVVRSERGGPGAPAALLLLAALQATPAAPFDSGIALYRSGNFAEAARAFETVVAADSANVSAWIDLGNAYYRSGEQGRAVWAWARALRATPRDRALLANLQAAGAVEVLRTRPPLSVRPVEWYLLAAIAWWLACALVVIGIVRRRPRTWSWALAPIAFMVVALAIGVLGDGRDYAVALEPETRLYSDPTVHSPVVRNVQAGAGLDVVEQRGEWLRVRTVADAEGWVERHGVGKLR
ncbi:MAG: BatD family protein [Gemmatimonadota bacterium]